MFNDKIGNQYQSNQRDANLILCKVQPYAVIKENRYRTLVFKRLMWGNLNVSKYVTDDLHNKKSDACAEEYDSMMDYI